MIVKHLNFERFYRIFKTNYPRKLVNVPFSDSRVHHLFYCRCGQVIHHYGTFDYKEFKSLMELME